MFSPRSFRSFSSILGSLALPMNRSTAQAPLPVSPPDPLRPLPPLARAIVSKPEWWVSRRRVAKDHQANCEVCESFHEVEKWMAKAVMATRRLPDSLSFAILTEGLEALIRWPGVSRHQG
jgi:hypothetical protein